MSSFEGWRLGSFVPSKEKTDDHRPGWLGPHLTTIEGFFGQLSACAARTFFRIAGVGS
jgi:hypothetical protein